MNVKSILLGTAAALVASGAYAADLPGEAAPAAVDYVKVCDAFGAGFFYIPGTDTCLDISGRFRGGIAFSSSKKTRTGSGTTADPYVYGGGTEVDFTNAARVQFDARSATDLGTLRAFAEVAMEDSDRGAKFNNVFVQLGYVTVGRQDDLTDGDVLYGDEGFTGFNAAFGDTSYNGITVLADNLGGGFYAGAGVYGSGAVENASVLYRDVDTGSQESHALIEGIVGIAKQSWGSADLSGGYLADSQYKDSYFVKATAEFLITSELSARLTAAYVNLDSFAAGATTGKDVSKDWETVSAAVKYQATPDLDVYAGGVYAFQEGDDGYALQIGADYMLAKGLTLTAEVNYTDKFKSFGTDSSYSTANNGAQQDVFGIVRLSREW